MSNSSKLNQILCPINRGSIHEKGLMGKLKNLENDKWWGGPVPFGYELDENKRLIENERLKLIKMWINLF